MPGRYGSSDDDPRIDPSFSLESYANPTRVTGPIRAITSVPSAVTAPFSIGADTLCANANLRVTGGGHITLRLGVGVCPISTTPGIDVAGPVQPDTDNTRTLGTAALRWSDLRSVLGTFSGDLTLGARLVLTAAVSKVVPGATSLSLRNTADSADNLLIVDAGDATLRTKLTLPGPLTLTTAASKIIPGATSLALRNTADSNNNLLLTDAGIVTARNSVVCNIAALATNATDGFIYLPTSAGTPTGTPTTQTGTVAAEYDTTNDKFQVYNGGWKSFSLAPPFNSIQAIGAIFNQTTTSTSEVVIATVPYTGNTITATPQAMRIRMFGAWSVASVSNMARIAFGANYIGSITGTAATTEFYIDTVVYFVNGTTQGFFALESNDTNLGTAIVDTSRNNSQVMGSGWSITQNVEFRGKVGSGTLTIDWALVELIKP